jgi:hypothetical protein
VVNGNTIAINSNSLNMAPTSIGGSLTLALAQSAYVGDSVTIQSSGTALAVGGNASVTTGTGSDRIQIANAWFKNALTLNTGSSLRFGNDSVSLDGTRIDGAASIVESGDFATLSLGTNYKYGPTMFSSTLVASLTGASGRVVISNPMSIKNEVIFASTAAFLGGTPKATMQIKGNYYAFRGKLTKTDFN